MHPLWIHPFFKGYILDLKMLGAWQGSTPPKDTWKFFQHKITPFKSQKSISFYILKSKQKNPTYYT